jgi:Zn-finger nucleic acid-binding protein
MDCPKCVGKLKEKQIGQKGPITIDTCFACGGIWFDKDELDLIVNKEIFDTVEFEIGSDPISDTALLIELDLDKKEIVCPRCQNNKKMVKKHSQRNDKVLIDYCESCGGIWLDAGEYNRISKRSVFEDKIENFLDFFRLHFPHLFREKR